MRASRTHERWFAVLNPVSGGGRAARDRAQIEALLRAAKLDATLQVSDYAGHAIALAAAAVRDGYRRIAAIGGDGTLNEVVNGVLEASGGPSPQATIALLPVGRGDDWARTHGIPRRLDAAVGLIAAGRTVLHDVGIARFGSDGRERYYINVAGVGFDADVVQRTQATRLGPMSYLVGLLRSFATYRARRLAVDCDALHLDEPLFVVFAALGRYCGGGMYVAPGADTGDGLLDLITIAELGKLELILNLRRLFDGTLPLYRKVRTARVARVEVDAVERVAVQADGELIGHTPVTFSVVPGALRVVVP